MIRTSSGRKSDLRREAFHKEIQDNIRQNKKPFESCFGSFDSITQEDFIKSCETATKMYNLGIGKWNTEDDKASEQQTLASFNPETVFESDENTDEQIDGLQQEQNGHRLVKKRIPLKNNRNK